MKLVKLTKDGEKRYFSSISNAARFLDTIPVAVRNSLILNTRVKGWKTEFTEDPDVLNKYINME